MTQGCWFSGTESSAELYDPVKGVFTDAGNMTAPREFQTATLLNSGDVLLAGGAASENAGYGTTASAELHYPYRRPLRPRCFPLPEMGGVRAPSGTRQRGNWLRPKPRLSPSEAG